VLQAPARPASYFVNCLRAFSISFSVQSRTRIPPIILIFGAVTDLFAMRRCKVTSEIPSFFAAARVEQGSMTHTYSRRHRPMSSEQRRVEGAGLEQRLKLFEQRIDVRKRINLRAPFLGDASSLDSECHLLVG
jgi:hypothetical protein